MKLQEKASLILVILLILVITLISLFVSAISLTSYSSLEHTYVLQETVQAAGSLNTEYASLSAVAAGWGPWDDTYNFVMGNEPDYIRTNLVPDAYRNLGLDIITITNQNGNVVYAGAYDPENRRVVAAPESFRQQLTPENPLLNTTDPHRSITGIMVVDNNPLIVASQPVIHSDFSGTPDGVVIVGRYLDENEVRRLGNPAFPSLRVIPVGDPALSPSLLSQINGDSAEGTNTIVPLNRTTVAGYTLIHDIYGNDAFVLQIVTPRDIYQQGITMTLSYIFIVLGAGLLFGIVVLLLLDRLVLSRVSSLSSQVHDIGRQTEPSGRVSVEGSDEFSELSGEINRMLGTIEKTQQGLQKSEERFRELSDLLPLTIFELDLNANLTYVNKHAMELFGLTEKDLENGLNARQLMKQEDVERMERNLKKVAVGERSPGEIYALIKKDKNLMQAMLFSSPIIHDGRLEGFRGCGIDISERVRLEEALTESEEYLQELIRSIRVGIIVIDTQTHTIIDVNPAALEMMGTTKDAVINKLCQDVICPAEVGRCPITDLNQTVDNSERTLLTPDGREISIIKYVVPLMLHGKSCLLETFVDNTYRKQIELKLAESEEKYRALAENSADVLFSLDMAGICTYISPQVNTYGFLEDEITGKPIRNFIHTEDIDRVEQDLARDLEKGAQFHTQFRALDKWGNVIWFDEKGTLRLDQSGKPIGIYGVLRDITERKKVEEALAESEEKYRAITENTPDLLFSADLSGVVTYVSPQINQYGFLVDEIVGQPLFNNIHPEDRKNVADKLRKDLHEGAQFIATFRFLDKWGDSHWFEEKSSLLLDQFGKPVGIYGIFRDITEQKRAEEAIELANKKLNLMNNITRHDILNTITGLLGCVDMASTSTSPEEMNQLFRDIRELIRVIQWQISFTKEYQEVGVRLPRWQNVADVLQRILVKFEKSGLRFITDLEKTEIYADPLLEKVFYNLVDNAIRYGEKVTTITFYFQISDKGLSLMCEDDGAGIPPEQKAQIFERGVGRNTGMGLFLTREILGITGITIVENGVYGKGARFEIHIPRGTFRFVR